MSRQSLSVLLAVSLSFVNGWSGAPAVEIPEEEQSRTVTYRVTGVLREVDPDGVTAKIAHDEIPNYMPAMTMDFSARDPGVLAGLKPGDPIAFRLSVGNTESWIDRLQRLAASASAPAGAAVSEPIATSGNPARLRPGDRVPRVRLVDQNSRVFTLEELRGKVWAFTFIFTRCPLPDYCPRLNRHFAEAQRVLSTEEGSKVQCHFLSITIDPEFDTPARLAAYSQLYGADPARWTFATGDPKELAELSGAFGLEVSRKGEQLDHNLRTIVVDADGRVQRIFIGNKWKPEDLVREIRHAAQQSGGDEG